MERKNPKAGIEDIMKDCLGNEVVNFVPNERKRILMIEGKKGIEPYLRKTLMAPGKLAVRVYDQDREVIGWNIISRE